MVTLQKQLIRVFVLALAFCAISCSSSNDNDSADAGDPFADVKLTRLEGPQLRMEKQSTQVLRVQATNSRGEPLAGVPIEWGFSDMPPEGLQFTGAPVTDASGIASATVTVADEMDWFEVLASLPDGSKSVKWNLGPVEFRLRGRGAPPALTVTDAPLDQRVEGTVSVQSAISLKVCLSRVDDAGEVGMPGERIEFHLVRGVSGTSLMSADPGFTEVSTTALGCASATLKVGATTGRVTVAAAYENLPVVVFDLELGP